MGKRAGEIDAFVEPLVRRLRERLGESRPEIGQLGSTGPDRRYIAREVLTDDDRRIGVLKRRSTGQQLKSGRRQCILVGAAVDPVAHELFGRGVRNGSHGHVGSGQIVRVTDAPGDPEVRQHDSLIGGSGVGQQDVGGLDVAVEQSSIVGVVECVGDGRDDPHHVFRRHSVRVALRQEPVRVGAVDVVHRDPELAVDIAAVVHLDDVLVPQRGRDVGLPVEALPVLTVGTDGRREHLERVVAWQAGVLRQVDLAHATGAQ